MLPWKVSWFGSNTQVWDLEHQHQLSILPELTTPLLLRASVLLFNGKSALQTQLNCSSGMKFNFHIVQCHADTVKFCCKYWCEKYLLRTLNHAIFHFFCITKLCTQPVRYKFHLHSLVILINHAWKNLQSFSHRWKCVTENGVCRMCFLKKLWMPYFKMINAPWAVIIFLKALNCNPYWKQETSSSDQQYKCFEMTKYSVFSKIHRETFPNLNILYSVKC